MIFYYHTIFSLILIGLIYVVGTAALAVLWYLLRRWKVVAWALVVPLWLGLLVAPWLEELWIAYHFGQACKDAGLVITKKVQVEGFYDDTRETHAGPRTPQGAEELDHSGYRFYEMKPGPARIGQTKVVHLEKTNGEWVATVVEHPTARYHFQQPYNHARLGHKITKIERMVIDSETGTVIARERIYGRDAPWYFLGLDRSLLQCPPHGLHPELPGKLLYQIVLEPTKEP